MPLLLTTQVTSQTIQYSYDLVEWFDLPATAATSGVSVTTNLTNIETEDVTLELSPLEQDGEIFVRLRAQ